MDVTNLLIFAQNYLINLEVVVVGEPPEYWRVDLNSVPQIVTDPNPGSSSPWEVEELVQGLQEDHLDHQEEVVDQGSLEVHLDHLAMEACFQEVEGDNSSHC